PVLVLAGAGEILVELLVLRTQLDVPARTDRLADREATAPSVLGDAPAVGVDVGAERREVPAAVEGLVRGIGLRKGGSGWKGKHEASRQGASIDHESLTCLG